MDNVQMYLTGLLVIDAVAYVGTLGILIGKQSNEKMIEQVGSLWPAVHLPLLPIIGRIFGWW